MTAPPRSAATMQRVARTGAWALVLAAGASALLAACAVGADDGPDVGGGYYATYYEPYGYDYGGWGGDYRVGPGRRGERGGRAHGGHAYHAAPAGRRAPSIPSQSHRR